jgi:hypothetical protein
MSSKPSSVRYYHNRRDTLKQLPQVLPIVLMFVLTLVFASGLQNQTTKMIMLYLSLVYLAVILFSLSFSIPKISYYQVDSGGIHVTILVLFHKHIYWSDIESIGPAVIGGPVSIASMKGIGLMYVPIFSRYVFGRKSRRRMFGWDELLSNAHAQDGTSLDAAVTEHFKKHLSSAKR